MEATMKDRTKYLYAAYMYGRTPDFLKESFARAAHEPDELIENKL